MLFFLSRCSRSLNVLACLLHIRVLYSVCRKDGTFLLVYRPRFSVESVNRSFFFIWFRLRLPQRHRYTDRLSLFLHLAVSSCSINSLTPLPVMTRTLKILILLSPCVYIVNRLRLSGQQVGGGPATFFSLLRGSIGGRVAILVKLVASPPDRCLAFGH